MRVQRTRIALVSASHSSAPPSHAPNGAAPARFRKPPSNRAAIENSRPRHHVLSVGFSTYSTKKSRSTARKKPHGTARRLTTRRPLPPPPDGPDERVAPTTRTYLLSYEHPSLFRAGFVVTPKPIKASKPPPTPTCADHLDHTTPL